MWEQLDEQLRFVYQILKSGFRSALRKFENVRRMSWHARLRISENAESAERVHKI